MKDIFVFTYNIDTFTNPTLLAFFEEALNRGHSVSVFMPKQVMGVPDNLKELKLFTLHINSGLFPKCRVEILNVLKSTWCVVKNWRATKNRIVIAVDPNGLCIASRFLKILNSCAFGYFSFEIIFRDETKEKHFIDLKQNEVNSSKRIDFCIIQDEKREELLKQENQISDRCRFFQVPVAPQIKHQFSPMLKANHGRYRIVSSGSMAVWSGVDAVLGCMNSQWNQDFCVEFHSRFKLLKDHTYRQKIEKMSRDGLPVSLHDEPFLEENEYHTYLNMFDIGLALYFPYKIKDDIYTGKNIDFIGLSSGKFSTYMMLGIPTITMFNPVYQSLNNEFRFGYVMQSINELPYALAVVSKNYTEYKKGCLRLYEARLNPQVTLNSLFEYIKEIH